MLDYDQIYQLLFPVPAGPPEDDPAHAERVLLKRKVFFERPCKTKERSTYKTNTPLCKAPAIFALFVTGQPFLVPSRHVCINAE
jgi:hypothetical protein